MEYAYAAAPAVGHVHERHGNQYEIVAVKPYTRRDGTPSSILTWRGSCAQCGDAYYQSAGLITKSLNRRCSECVNPRKPATTSARKAKSEARQRNGKKAAANAKARKELFS